LSVISSLMGLLTVSSRDTSSHARSLRPSRSTDTHFKSSAHQPTQTKIRISETTRCHQQPTVTHQAPQHSRRARIDLLRLVYHPPTIPSVRSHMNQAFVLISSLLISFILMLLSSASSHLMYSSTVLRVSVCLVGKKPVGSSYS
jgi:hypothetical protein